MLKVAVQMSVVAFSGYEAPQLSQIQKLLVDGYVSVVYSCALCPGTLSREVEARHVSLGYPCRQPCWSCTSAALVLVCAHC
jgi:hypothetical protein